jgi:hypothetical protein
MRLSLFFIFTYLPSLVFAQFDMSSHFEQNATLTQDEFLERFPYKAYLKNVPFTDFKTLQVHRRFLNTADTLHQGMGD